MQRSFSRAKSDIAIYETKNSPDPLDLALFLNRQICQEIIDIEVFNGRLIMILLLGSISCVMKAYAAQLGKELSSFKLIKYLLQDHFFALSIQMGTKKQLIVQLYQDVGKPLCQDKRQRLSLRKNVKLGIHYNNLKNKDLCCLAV